MLPFLALMIRGIVFVKEEMNEGFLSLMSLLHSFELNIFLSFFFHRLTKTKENICVWIDTVSPVLHDYMPMKNC